MNKPLLQLFLLGISSDNEKNKGTTEKLKMAGMG